MNAWMQEIQEQIAEIEVLDVADLKQPLAQKNLGETVVGEVPDDLKPLFHLGRQYADQLKELSVEAEKFLGNDAESFTPRLDELSSKYDQVMHLFWISLKEQLGLWGKPIGIREGWKVVTMQPSPPMPGLVVVTLGPGL